MHDALTAHIIEHPTFMGKAGLCVKYSSIESTDWKENKRLDDRGRGALREEDWKTGTHTSTHIATSQLITWMCGSSVFGSLLVLSAPVSRCV